MKPEIYRDALGKWRWRVKSPNHRIVAASSQGFKTKWWCKRNWRKFSKPEIVK